VEKEMKITVRNLGLVAKKKDIAARLTKQKKEYSFLKLYKKD